MGLREMIDAPVLPRVLEIQDNQGCFPLLNLQGCIKEKGGQFFRKEEDTYITLDCR